MTKSSQNVKEIVQSAGWQSFFIKLENICALILVLAILFNFAVKPNSEFLVNISFSALTTLVVMYFFLIYYKYSSDSEFLQLIFYRVYGFGLSLGFLTIIAIIHQWPLPVEIMSISSLILLSISILLGIREEVIKNRKKLNWRYFARIIATAIAILYLNIFV